MSEPPRSDRAPHLERAAIGLLGAATISAPVMIGAVHWPVALGLCAVTLCGAALATLHRARYASGRGERVSALSLAWLAAAWISALQIMPWPKELLSLLSPRRVALHEEAVRAGLILNDVGALMPSLDPGATADMTLRFVTLAALVWGLENLSARARRRRALLVVPILAALVSFAVGLGQMMLDPELFLGFYRAERAPLWGSTFVNGNQAAALGLVGTSCAVTLATARGIKRQRERALWATLALVCGAMIATQTSAGVWALALLTALGAGAYYAAARRRLTEPKAARWGVSALTLGGVILAWAAAITWPRVSQTLGGSLPQRAEMARSALSESALYPLLGSGSWSVERALSGRLDWAIIGESRVETIEAELLEWPLTLGWPAALLIIAALWLTWSVALGEKSRPRRGAAMWAYGLLVVGLAQMHFPFFMLGLGMPLLWGWVTLRERLVARLASASEEAEPRLRERLTALARGVAIRRRALSLILALTALGAVALASARLVGEPGRVFNAEIAHAPVERLEALAYALPSEAQLYVRAAQASGQPAAREALLERAYLLEPTASHEAAWAASMWPLEPKRERARAHFIAALSHQRDGPRQLKVLGVTLDAVRAPAERAELLEGFAPALWGKSWRAILEVEGELAAQDFLEALIALRPRDVAAQAQLIDLLIARERWELLALNAELLSMYRFDDEQGGRALAARAAYEAARSRGDRRGEEAARAVIASRLEVFSHDPTLSVALLEQAEYFLGPGRTAKTLEALHRAAALRCGATTERDARHACGVYKAWREELERGDMERAERAWKALLYATDDIDALGAFYERRGQCLSLRKLTGQAAKSSKDRQRRAENALQRRYERCTSVELRP